ncbi:hypothetical protein BJ912DRAFT_849809 [Pholiota molesta]|nr:hypothetical protein BJ912DRAFT_849809 [Pholiota molesta]
MSQATEPPMPARGDRSAPEFNSADPRELERFFSELENLFSNRPSLQDQRKKEHALRFLKPHDAEQWRGIPEFDDNTKTFAEFKKAVELAYPTASEAQRYTMYHIDALTGLYSRAGMHSQDDLANYTREFRAIARSIIKSGAAGESDLARAYIRGFQPQVWEQILVRLATTKANFVPMGPYSIAEINEAANFIMQIHFSVNMASAYLAPNTTAYSALANTSVGPTGSSMVPVPYAINKTGLSLSVNIPTVLAQIGTALERITASMQQGNGSSSRYSNSGDQSCNFCGGPHFIRDCEVVEDYVRAGKCKRNIDNKVVLPSGVFVPRNIPGLLLKDRIEEWHRRFPNQLANGIMTASTMMLNASHANEIYSHSTTPQPAVRLSVADQIAHHQSAIFNLESRRPGFTPIIKTRNQRQQEANETAREPTPAPARQAAASTSATRDAPPHLPQTTSRVSNARPATPPPSRLAQQEPEHPYRNANDAAYAPPQARNVGAPPDKANAPRREPAYRTLPPVHDPALATKVFNQSMEASITITQRELLSLAPEVRSQYREATTIKRQPNKEAPTATTNLFDSAPRNEADSMPIFNLSFINAESTVNGGPPPRGASIINDPYDLYYRTLAPGERPDFDMLIVAVESAALRSMHAVVDGTLRVECVHIIRHAPYDVLFGRPFDIITTSVVRNYANEDQTITIKDVNSGHTATVPTFPRTFQHSRRRRGHHDPVEQEQGFQR